jgi:hypothetical protein
MQAFLKKSEISNTLIQINGMPESPVQITPMLFFEAGSHPGWVMVFKNRNIDYHIWSEQQLMYLGILSLTPPGKLTAW